MLDAALTPASTPESFAYIARCGVCGGLVMAIADKPERRRDIAREVADAILAGDTVERVSVLYVRNHWSTDSCRCGDGRPGESGPATLLENGQT